MGFLCAGGDGGPMLGSLCAAGDGKPMLVVGVGDLGLWLLVDAAKSVAPCGNLM
jgi:hypothetical protein